MTPRIEVLKEKKLIGKCMEMTLTDNRTQELWQSFMPDRNKIKNRVSNDLISMQVYDRHFDFNNFTPHVKFTKWAGAEVSEVEEIPEGMSDYTLKGGLYAVFTHKGTPNDFHKTFKLIFHDWLPQSAYEVDQREHFEVLGDKYKNNDPSSEEEVWVPIKKK